MAILPFSQDICSWKLILSYKFLDNSFQKEPLKKIKSFKFDYIKI